MSIVEDAQAKFAKGEELKLDRLKFDKLVDEIKTGLYKFVPPGHFYSPINDINDVEQNNREIWNKNEFPGVAINQKVQHDHLVDFFRFAEKLPFTDDKQDGFRYYYINNSYSYADAITLFCMIMKYSPKKIIEVGSGLSSCVMLDTNEHFFNNSIDMTFIEPYPDFFFSVIKPGDKEKNKVIAGKLQNIPLSLFESLEENDILFIDSSHVSKFNSDVNQVFFEILPRLKKGVLVHFHDIFYPFEYPHSWLLEGRSWNEIYMLRSFLQFNSDFEIIFMSTYVFDQYQNEISKGLPEFLKNSGGNIWLRRK